MSNCKKERQQPVISKFFKKVNSLKRGRNVANGDIDECEKPKKTRTNDLVVCDAVEKNNVTLLSKTTLKKLSKFDLSSKEESNIIDTKKVEKEYDKQRKSFKDSICQIPNDAKTYRSLDLQQSSGGNILQKDITSLKIPNSKNVKYTPLEQQFLDIKRSNPNTLLFVECGYKYRFFGEDAERAAEELNIYCHQDHNFMTASIPTHRLNVHVSRLISKGFKVGVVKQTETAALKAAGDNRSAPFTRKLTNVYTKATFIDGSLDEGNTSDEVGGHLMCIYEEEATTSSKMRNVAILSVDISTGGVIYDTFLDNHSNFELETRVTHIQPLEIVMSQKVSDSVKKFINSCRHDFRTEELAPHLFHDTDAVSYLKNELHVLSANLDSIRKILTLPSTVLCCLSAVVYYLQQFGLMKVLKLDSFFHKFNEYNKHMDLCGLTLKNLEILNNNHNGKKEGSLFWLLDQTQSAFGSRVMKSWLSHPLTRIREIEQRQEAIEEIIQDESFTFIAIRNMLKEIPDVDKALTLIFYRKCSPMDFVCACEALLSAKDTIEGHKCGQSSTLLKQISTELPQYLSDVEIWVKSINKSAARNSSMTELFVNEAEFPEIQKEKELIAKVLLELENHKREIRRLLHQPSLEYNTVLGTEFLIEVQNKNVDLVPKDWIKINSTKALTRYHSPFIIETYKKLSQHRETLSSVCHEAWQHFLGSFENVYSEYKKAVIQLSVLDCLMALAKVAKQYEYTRPEVIESPGTLEILQGRHPIVDVLLNQNSQQFVPNDTNLKNGSTQCMIITGPNMGGKSSYIKQVALITLMAQIGSFVPACAAKISICDGIYTRMGANDDLFKGRSTFMVELLEASEVMKKATERSLVVLDELGRGTSTHDGVAIAQATLYYFIKQVKCLTLFVTHYPSLVEAEKVFPTKVVNYHMSFYVQEQADQLRDDLNSLTFLYQLVKGEAHSSYGLNVARLANIPSKILKKAAEKSKSFEVHIVRKSGCEQQFKNLFSKNVSKKELLSFLFEGKL